MYIIRKAILRIENNELVDVGYARVKKCNYFDQVDNFMKGIPQSDLHNYSATEYTCDPDKYPVNSDWVQDISGEDWYLG